MNTKLNKLVLAIGALVMAGGAMAATDTADLAVGATVENACAIGPGTLAFGTLSLGVNADGTVSAAANYDVTTGTSISIACTLGVSAAITAGPGLNAALEVRKMISGSDLLTYELYTTSARDEVLNGTNSISYTGTGVATTTAMIYGRITSAQVAAAKKGSYADTVVMTITYAL